MVKGESLLTVGSLKSSQSEKDSDSVEVVSLRSGSQHYNASESSDPTLVGGVHQQTNFLEVAQALSPTLAATKDAGDLLTPESSGSPLPPVELTSADLQEITEDFTNRRTCLKGENCTYNLKASSLFIFSPESFLRRKAFVVVDHRYFERAVLIIIALNCVSVILSTPGIIEQPGMSTVVFVGEILFQTLFTLEMMVKVFALGFAMHEHSYLRSPWNRMDFVIVVLGFVSFGVGTNVSAVRLVRMLRPLRAVSHVPQLAALVSALIQSTPKLADVLLLLTFILVIFSVLGLQLYVGTIHQRCYYHAISYVVDNTTGAKLPNGTYPVLAPDEYPCSQSPLWGHQCAPNAHCEVHKSIYAEPLFHFDNIGNSFVTVLKIISMDNWPVNVWHIQYVTGSANFIFGFAIVMFGSHFCLNLILAILSSEYDAATKDAEKQVQASEEEGGPIDGALLHLAESDSFVEDDEEMEEARTITPDHHSRYAATRSPSPPLPDMVVTAATSHRHSSGHATPTPGAPENVRRASLLSEQSVESHSATATSSRRVRRKKKAKQLPCWQWFNRALLQIVTHPYFNHVILFITVVNVLVLAIDHHPIDPTLELVLDWINFACSICFILELIAKLTAMGLSYFKDGFNIFDCLLVIVSIPEMVVGGSGSGSAFSALRAFRLLRVFRVVKASKRIKKLLLTVFKAASAASYLFLLLGLYILVFGLVGVDLFHHAIPSDMRPNFNNLGDSLLTVFIVITGENWMSITQETMLGSNWLAVIFFIIMFCFGNYLVINLFVAILIDSFSSSAHDSAEEEQDTSSRATTQEEKKAKQQQVILALRHSVSTDPVLNSVDEAPEGETQTNSVEAENGNEDERPPDLVVQHSLEIEDQDGDGMPERQASSWLLEMRHRVRVNRTVSDILRTIFGKKGVQSPTHSEGGYRFMCFTWPLSQEVHGKSFKVFAEDNKFRLFCAHIVDHPIFELFIVIMILASCIMLGFDNPTSRSSASVTNALFATDIIFCIVFAVEALGHCIAWGVMFGPNAYLTNPWNRLDAIVVVSLFVGFFVPFVGMLRSLRCFKLGARAESLRVVIAATFKALPHIANVALLLLFGFVVFGILGVQLFKGSFVYCNDQTITYRTDCVGNFTLTEETVTLNEWSEPLITSHNVTQQRRWETTFFNFDHLGSALLTLFALALSDGWSVVLWQAMDSRSYDQALTPYSRPYMGLFVVIFVIFGCFFMMNLFIGSLIDSFSQERAKKEGKIDESGNPLLSNEQAEWLRAYRIAKSARIEPPAPVPGNWYRKLCCGIYFARNDRKTPDVRFEYAITALILLNTAIMCIQYDGMPRSLEDALWWMNLVFAIIYTIEGGIKMGALMPSGYFGDPWNRFDFALIPLAYFAAFVGGPGTNAIRVLRVARALRLIKRAEGLARLFHSILYAIPQLLNVLALLVLTLFVFAVIGVDLFGLVITAPEDASSSLHQMANFQNAGNAMILLYEIASTEGWWDIMRSCMVTSENSLCSSQKGNCGSYFAIPYFVLFMLAANCVCINLFIFVVVDNYLEVQSLAGSKAARVLGAIEMFRDDWSRLDSTGSQLIHWEVVLGMFKRFPDDVAFPKKTELRFLRYLRIMRIPLDAQLHVDYNDCVRGITQYLYGLNEEQLKSLSCHLEGEEGLLEEDTFMMQHALAAQMIARRWRQKKREQELTLKASGAFIALLNRSNSSPLLEATKDSPVRGGMSFKFPQYTADEHSPNSDTQCAELPKPESPDTSSPTDGYMSQVSSGYYTNPGGEASEPLPGAVPEE